MSSLNDSNTTDSYDQSQVVIMGGTDNTKIGNVNDALKITGSIDATTTAQSTGSYFPVPSGTYHYTDAYDDSNLTVDYMGNLSTRGPVLTDEGSFRDDFSYQYINGTLTGSLTFTNGSQLVTGVGTYFTSELDGEKYIKLQTDSGIYYQQVLNIYDDENLDLYEPYSGTSGSGTANWAYWLENYSGTGSNISILNSVLSLVSGTSSTGYSRISREGDYGPIVYGGYLSITDRRANQEIEFALEGKLDGRDAACFIFTGTDNTKVTTVTSSSSNLNDLETNTVTLPIGTTAEYHRYRVEISHRRVSFFIDDIEVSTHRTHIPGLYEVINPELKVLNTGAVAGSTTVNCDYVYFENLDVVGIGTEFTGKPIDVVQTEDVHYITGKLSTNSNTADQLVLSYTVPSNKKFYIIGYHLETDNNGSNICKLGKNTMTSEPASPGIVDHNIFRLFKIANQGTTFEDFSTPRRIGSAGDIIKLLITPNANNATNWRATIDFVLR